MNSRSQLKNNPAAKSMKYISRRGGYVALILNVLLFAFMSYWLYYNIKFADLILELKQIPLNGILMAMAMNVFVLLFYASRIAVMLGGGLTSCFIITNIGFTFNSIMPFRAGEGIKIYFAHSYYDYSIGRISAAVLLEKLYDLTAIIILSLLVLARSNSSIINYHMLVAAALIIVIIFSGIFIFRSKGVIWSLPDWSIVKTARLDAVFKQAELLVASHSMARVALFTASIWITNVSLVFILFKTLLPEIDFGFIQAMTLLIIGALAIAVPSSPAGLGIFEAGIVAYLVNGFGVQNERAISAALAYHFSITAPHTLIIIVFLGTAFVRFLKERSTP